MLEVFTQVILYLVLYCELNWAVQCIQIDRMECKVVKPLLEYDSICRKALVRLTLLHTQCISISHVLGIFE